MIKIASLVAVCALLSGCATASRMTPDQALALVDAFHKAGCGGQIDVAANAGTGQLGGQASISLGLHGSCPQADPVVP